MRQHYINGKTKTKTVTNLITISFLALKWRNLAFYTSYFVNTTEVLDIFSVLKKN